MAKKKKPDGDSGLKILSPAPDSIYNVGSRIPVLAELADRNDKSYVFARVESAKDAQPDGQNRPLGHATERSKDGTFGRMFQSAHTVGKYRVVVTSTSDRAGKKGLETQVREFEVRKQEKKTVNAKHCPWFYTESLILVDPGPFSDPLSQCTPTAVFDIPAGATLADITVTSTVKTWAHGDVSTTTSDADGYKMEQVKDEYFNLANPTGPGRMNKIAATATEPSLNQLVGLLRIGGTDTYQQFPIGLSITDVNLNGFSRLILAHHDGFEWHNNSGDLEVTVDFRS